MGSGELPASFENESSPMVPFVPSEHLNTMQNQWLRDALTEPVLSLLHGPPGTGKTTAVLAFVAEAVNRRQRLLLSAPSNAAVDLLVEGCAKKGLSVVRIGHPMRLG